MTMMTTNQAVEWQLNDLMNCVLRVLFWDTYYYRDPSSPLDGLRVSVRSTVRRIKDGL